MMIEWPAKDPAAIADYAIDWTPRLVGAETVTGRTVTAVGVTKNSDALVGNVVTVWLSGGVAGTLAKVTISVTTSGGRTFSTLALLPIGGGPIDLVRAKSHLRVDFDEDDTLIAAYLRASVGVVERLTGRILSPRALTQRVKAFPSNNGGAIRLFHDPVIEVVEVTYLDADDAEQTLDEADYRSIEGEPWSLLAPLNGSWPPTADRSDAVRVRYMAGYEAGDCPPELQSAVLLMLGHLYANREGVSDRPGAETPLGVKELCAPFRRVML